MSDDTFPKRLLELMKEFSTKDVYINPHLLVEISGLLYEFYELEDDGVDQWINEMFGR